MIAVLTRWAGAWRPIALGRLGTLAAGLLLTATTLRAESGNLDTVPPAHGLTLTIDTRWVDAGGYRPVWVEAKSPTPLTAARTLSLQFHFRGYWWGEETIVTQELEIPAGASRGEVLISVPQFAAWGYYDLEVKEGNRDLDKLSFENHGLANIALDWNEDVPSLLYISDAPPPAFDLVYDSLWPGRYQSMGNTFYTPTMPGTVAPAPAAPAFLAQMVTVKTLDRLSDRWIDYTSLDLICIPLAELETLAANRPKVLDAIRRWASAGGNLLVTGVGDQWENLESLEKALALPARSADDSLKPEAHGWEVPNPADITSHMPNLNQNQWGYAQSYTMAGGMAVAPQVIKPGSLVTATNVQLAANPHFVTRRFGLGTVVALSKADPLVAPTHTTEEWRWVLNTLGEKRYLWTTRFGLSHRRENNDYWNFLIDGVGLAPVTTFQVLISLFVIGIGPVNYYFLRRTRRLHLLILTTPLAALAVTLSLFGYAILSDGMGVRVRSRTLTRIDQARGEAVAWSRLSYYAGLAPGRGLAFPGDVAVLPLEAAAEEYYGGMNNEVRRVDWRANQQLSDGWLSSRTPTQFMTVRARPTERALKVRERTGGSNAPRVENLLGTRIRRLYLFDSQGSLFTTADLAEEAVTFLDPISAEDASTELARLLAIKQPRVSNEMGRFRQGVLGMGGSSFFGNVYYSNWTGNMGAAHQFASVLETNFLSLGRAGALALPDVAAPRTYIAIVDRSPEIEFGVDEVREEPESLHLIAGSW